MGFVGCGPRTFSPASTPAPTCSTRSACAWSLADVRPSASGRSADRGQGLSPRSAAYAVVILNKALGFAVDQGYIARNPAARVPRPQGGGEEMRTWTAEEAAAFLDHVADDRLYVLWLILLQRGLRRGEAAGEHTEVVSKWLGHSSVSVTQDIYQHVLPSMVADADAGARIDEIVFSRRRAEGTS